MSKDSHHSESCVTLSPVVFRAPGAHVGGAVESLHLSLCLLPRPALLCGDTAAQRGDRPRTTVRYCSYQTSPSEEAHLSHCGKGQSAQPVQHSPPQASGNRGAVNQRYDATKPAIDTGYATVRHSDASNPARAHYRASEHEIGPSYGTSRNSGASDHAGTQYRTSDREIGPGYGPSRNSDASDYAGAHSGASEPEIGPACATSHNSGASYRREAYRRRVSAAHRPGIGLCARSVQEQRSRSPRKVGADEDEGGRGYSYVVLLFHPGLGPRLADHELIQLVRWIRL